MRPLQPGPYSRGSLAGPSASRRFWMGRAFAKRSVSV